jgi:hypothetical protein
MRLIPYAMLGGAAVVLSCGSGVATASAGGPKAWPIAAKVAAARAGRPLLAVSCSSQSACTAVGGVFAERWNGRRWSVQNIRAPAFSDPSFDFLAGVSCANRRACIAVGSERPPIDANVNYDSSVLATFWNGSTWSGRSPTVSQTANGYLLGVSCPSASDCIAVGQQGTSAFAMQWQNNRWQISPTPIASTGMSVLNGLSCTSATRCIAVGYTVPNPVTLPRPLVEGWNGSAWSLMPAPRTTPFEATLLNAISCWRRACTAVGGIGTHQLVERWNGHTWSKERAAAGGNSAELNGVSCVSRADCFAVGTHTDSRQAIAERGKGSRWSVEHTPKLAGGSLLWAVSCPSAGECMAVGSRGGLPLLEHWNGATWATQTAR